jgi:frataxin-like iron-binding protein CyaY
MKDKDNSIMTIMKTRKELKEEYKQMKYRMGVFQIKNKINGKVFIGSSTDLKAIWYAQKLQLDAGMHHNSDLQKEWKEYGAEKFIYELLEEIKQTEDKPADYTKEVKALEEMIIEELQPYEPKGYHKKRTSSGASLPAKPCG